jgi:hypothetical protein
MYKNYGQKYLKGRGHLGDLGVDVVIILRLLLEKQDVKWRLD